MGVEQELTGSGVDEVEWGALSATAVQDIEISEIWCRSRAASMAWPAAIFLLRCD